MIGDTNSYLNFFYKIRKTLFTNGSINNREKRMRDPQNVKRNENKKPKISGHTNMRMKPKRPKTS